jgi:transcription elongation factor Elf1
MPKLTSDEYVLKEGMTCPSCGHTGCVEGERLDVDASGAWQNCSCNSCGAEWTDSYTLSGYDNLTEGETE